MKLTITETAIDCFLNDWRFERGDSVRIFVRYGGNSTIHEGFSLGINREPETRTGLQAEVSGIKFFMVEDDLWYLGGNNLVVDYEPETDEITLAIK